MNIPQVGSQVVVTTKHRNPILGEDPFKFTKIQGTVIQSTNWMTPREFMLLTTNPKHPKAIINASYVHSIDYVTGSGAAVSSDSRTFRVTSKSSGKSYIVSVNAGKVHCTCTGFEYRRYCKHSQAVSQKIKGE